VRDGRDGILVPAVVLSGTQVLILELHLRIREALRLASESSRDGDAFGFGLERSAGLESPADRIALGAAARCSEAGPASR
jgi:hypothetical protein